jgi:hypothetical protein
MRRAILLSAALLTVAGAASAYARQAPSAPPAPAVVMGDEAFVPEGARMVAAGRVTRIVPRPAGRFALAVREEPSPPDDPTAPPPSTELLLYDARSGRVTAVLGQGSSEEGETGRVFAGSVLSLAWVAGSDRALAVTQVRAVGVRQGDTAPPPVYAVSLIDAARGTVRPLAEGAPAAAPPAVFVSPRAAAALVRLAPGGEWRWLTDRGTLAGPIVGLPDAADAAPARWDADGHMAYFRAASSGYLVVDARTGKVTSLAALPAAGAEGETPTSPSPVRLVRGAPVTAALGSTARTLRPLWLTAGPEPDKVRPVFLAPDADAALLLGDASTALYTAGDDGALYARRLRRLSRAVYERGQAAVGRVKALHDAFEIGQALQRYADEHGGAYPPRGADLAALLAPYLSDTSVLGGANPFVYEFAGGKPPADGGPVPLGYVRTPAGRAVLGSDGTAVWKP